MSAAPSDGKPKEDVLLVGGPCESGVGYHVLRKREQTIELGEMRAVAEGKPIHGEVVELRPRPEHGRLFDVEVVLPAKRTEGEQPTGKGPPKVASDAYRANWDVIFGGEAPN